MIEERYLALGLSPGIRILSLIATVVAALSGMIILLSLVLPGRRAATKKEGYRRHFFAMDVFASLSLLACYIFNIVWEPTNDEFWIALLPVACLAIASLFARRQLADRRQLAGVVFAACLFFANGPGAILPQTKLDSDYWYQINQYLIQNAVPGDYIFTDRGYISEYGISNTTLVRTLSQFMGSSRTNSGGFCRPSTQGTSGYHHGSSSHCRKFRQPVISASGTRRPSMPSWGV
jgi:hypothetical protein